MPALQFVIEFFRNRRSDDEGATAVEYALLIGLIAIAIAAAATALAGGISTAFGAVVTLL